MFIYHYLKNPRQIGAITQSSKKLSETITSNIDLHKARNIIEIGAGGGAFTKMIIQKKAKNAKFFAIEINPKLALKLSNKIKGLDVEINTANNICEIMKTRNMPYADIIISGIPFAMLKKNEQKILLEQIHNALGKNGIFCTFAYTIPTIMANNFKKQLFNIFNNNVYTSPIVWQNIPPAFVYYCRKTF